MINSTVETVLTAIPAGILRILHERSAHPWVLAGQSVIALGLAMLLRTGYQRLRAQWRANDAANDFFSQLQQLPDDIQQLTLATVQHMTTMHSVMDDDTFPRQRVEAGIRCLVLMQRIRRLKLAYLSALARVVCSGVRITEPAHNALEHEFLQFCDRSTVYLEQLAVRLFNVCRYTDFILELGLFQLSVADIKQLADGACLALQVVSETAYGDYFSFPQGHLWRFDA
ncbi:TPA: hypothetical protein ACNIQM_002915 [Citrobacter werkmanii]